MITQLEKYGPVNTIVLSRSAGADNIYYPSTLPSNPIEIKISDNQILNGNNRDEFITNIYNKLNGLEYYINDFSSTGITYYNLCDRYNVKIGDKTYSCVMFNDEINVTQGLEENVYTEMPEDAETDYKKSDTTDRRINQTTLIVDKQQQEITALVDTTEDIQKEINPTKDATGTTFYLKDSTDAELVNFELEGKTTQETRSGKNILPSLNTTRTINGITFTKNNDGSITINGTATANAVYPINVNSTSNLQNIPIKNNTQYTLSCRGITSGITIQAYYNATYYTAPQTFTSISTVLGAYVIVSNGKTINNVTIYPQIEEGTTATEYEQYGAMPSPNYPSELVSVGYVNIFDNENWYNTLHNLNNESMAKEVVDGIEYYKFRPSGINNYQYMLGKFKENTQYTLTCKARQYVYQARNTTGFIFAYTDGTTTSVLINQTTTEYDYKITSQAGKTISYIKLSYYNNDYQLVRDIQLTEGTQEHSYISYGKYGIEVKTNSANYFDASKIKNSNISVSNDGQTILMPEAISGNGYTSTSSTLHELAPSLQVGDTVYLQFTRSSGSSNRYIYLNGSSALWYINTARTITQSDLDGIVALYGNRYDSGETGRITLTDFRIVKVQNTEWEQFKSKTFLYTLNQPLRGIGDTKDLLYIKNGMLYVDRKIGSIVLDGTQSISLVNWRPSDTSTGWIYSYNTTKNLIPQAGTTGKIMSTQLSPTSYGNLYAQSIDDGIALYNNNAYGIVIRTSDTSLTTKALVNNYLSQHPMIVDYALAEPYIEELGQVDIPNTYKTTTHIDTIDINEPNMNITYVRDTQLTNYVEEHISQIIVNEEGISSRVQTIEDSDYNSRLNAVEQKQTDTDLTIDIISTNIDKTNGEVRSVTTDTGFTFNENGLNIKKSDTDYNTLIDNTGTYYKDGETIISMTNKDGFLAKDFRLQGQHYYSYNATNPSEPLASENYDFVDERIEVEVDGQTQYAYATFYNGEV